MKLRYKFVRLHLEAPPVVAVKPSAGKSRGGPLHLPEWGGLIAPLAQTKEVLFTLNYE